MSLFDQGWGEDLSNSFSSLTHAPIDNTQTYGDNHGEATTKAVIAAGLLYGLGGFGGEGFGGEANLGMGGAGGESAGGGGGGGMLSQFGGSALNNIKNLFGGMGGGQQQQPRFNPFSPATPMPADSPYHPMQFQNQSFTPWMQNVTSMGMAKQQMPGPAEHIFAAGKGFF